MGGFESIKDLQEEKQTFLTRAVLAALLCFAMAMLLLSRLFNLQVMQQDYFQTRADENRMRVTPVAPVRGLIFDRNGGLLAQNKPAFVLEVIPEQVADLDALLERLSPIVSLTDKDVARFRERVRKSPKYRGVPLRTNLSMEEVARYEINRHDFRGVDVTAGLTRNYPLGASAAHVVGYVGGITEEELRRVDEAKYQGLSQIGKIGVEKSLEDLLRGDSGAKIIEANAYGRPLRELDYRRGYPGRNLVLSLDSRVQLVAEQALGELNGAIVAIDPRNGEVIALVSKPGFDPQMFVEGIDTKSYDELLNDANRPLFNRALQGQYPPGSTVKPAMAVAGLEYGVDPGHREFCRGELTLPGSTRKYRCHKREGHGWMDMSDAVMKSCDVYFYLLAMNLGIDRIHASMARFGLGRVTGIDVPLEKGGLFPSREWKLRVRKEAWYPGETLNVGIGQGYTLVTPLQLAQLAARIAMRGYGFKPHVVHATEDAITREPALLAPQPLERIELKSEQNWARVIQAMEDVAQSPGGTAYRIGHDAPYRIAAKTGTAQVAGMKQEELVARKLEATPVHLRDHAWFIAFAPAEAPRIAIAVLAEHAGHGGSVAGPIARQVMDQALLGEVRFDPDAVPPPVARAVAPPTEDVEDAVDVEVPAPAPTVPPPAPGTPR
ncbi:MAG TPA: penicillin-binding protein 2 [Solimonas sp.]|nr:penicillin-binding protein 2 [Solimonas sp.]